MKTISPVAVAGVGCICSLGPDLATTAINLFKDTRNPTVPERFSGATGLAFPCFEVPDDYLQDLSQRHPGTAKTYQLACQASREAMHHSTLDPKAFSGLRVGLCLGTNVGGSLGNLGPSRNETPYVRPEDRFTQSNPTIRLVDELGINGPFQTIVNACSAGNDALGIGAGWIDSGLCDLVLAGGADELYLSTYVGFKTLFINAEEPCRPFDLNRGGLNLGEGAAMFLLVSKRIQEAFGLPVRGYVLGYGATADAYHFTYPREDGLQLEQAIKDALAQSGRIPKDVAFICAHGTGTQGNDLVESNTLHKIFPKSPFFSSKGYTGHTLGAAGPIEAALTLTCLEQQRIPKTIGFTTFDPDLPAAPTNENMAIKGQIAVSQTLAFGGSNSVLILGGKDLP